ncbi:DUF4232 domain-containing protein [Streptomyces abyssalis]|uniref:DUF4232 domain-containing protein n=1 Tax=Streptomyces abyssalis TaxID=933944 RepID=A0A1E7JPG4_9ACTN|nr:DUF4232 domain-containing protein [Streptomyces abyssalis]OEU90158.1 hypothetical protein AN215_11410 [Streptomyces abyssalis]
MRNRLRLAAATTTVLAACSLVITGCGPKDDSGAGAPASSTSSTASPGGGAGESAGGAGGDGETEGRSAGASGNGGTGGGEAGDGGLGNHKPDAPACTEKNTAVTIRTAVGSGTGEIQVFNNSGRSCSVYGAPNLILKSSDGEILNPEPATDGNQEAPLVTVDSGSVATADLTYESGPVSEGGSQDGITCGKSAETAEVSNQDATWNAKIRANEAGDADAAEAGLIVCGPKTTVGPFQQ